MNSFQLIRAVLETVQYPIYPAEFERMIVFDPKTGVEISFACELEKHRRKPKVLVVVKVVVPSGKLPRRSILLTGGGEAVFLGGERNSVTLVLPYLFKGSIKFEPADPTLGTRLGSRVQP